MAYRADLFMHVLKNLQSGRTAEDASRELNDLVQQCQLTQKKGKLTLTLEIQPDGSTGQYLIADRVEITKPKLPRGKSLFWGTPEGNLQTTDPRQSDMFNKPSRVVEAESLNTKPAEVREV